MLELLQSAIKELGEIDPRDLTDDELTEVVVGLQQQVDALRAVHAKVAGNWTARRAWASVGARSGAAFLARPTRAPKKACGALLWLARVRSDMPLVAAAWAGGEIGLDHVRRFTGVHNHRTAAAFARDESMLVHGARTLSFVEFCVALSYWFAHADPDGPTRTPLPSSTGGR